MQRSRNCVHQKGIVKVKTGLFAGIALYLCLGFIACDDGVSDVDPDNRDYNNVLLSSSETYSSSDENETSAQIENPGFVKESSSSEKMSLAANGNSSSSTSSSSQKADDQSSSTVETSWGGTGLSSESSEQRNADTSSGITEILPDSILYSGETIAWYGSTTSYSKTKVVASNADELNCDETVNMDSLKGYDVAYEFNRPRDLGRDYLGNNNAYKDNETSNMIFAECGSIVFDGSGGLLIPLAEVFKSKSFVIEVRFMATEESKMGNIFVAEPPGQSPDGWQLRLDSLNFVTFHIRDNDIRKENKWETLKIGQVSLNEWHVVRVKIFPTKSFTGNISYVLNAYLDGKNRIATEYRGFVDLKEYGLGIGYDSMYQSRHAERFFTGKIDYIRYGKITEDDL